MPATTDPELIPHRTSIVKPLAVWNRDMQSSTSRPNFATLATASFIEQGVGAPQITTAMIIIVIMIEGANRVGQGCGKRGIVGAASDESM